MTEGDSYTKAFTTGDYLKVTFTGYNADNDANAVDYYLADYTSADESEHYMLKQWTWVDLSSLGNVVKLTVTLSASQSGVPAYVCLDQLGAGKPSSIDEAAKLDDEVSVYPVPASDVLYVSGIDDETQVSIYSISGQLVGTYQVADNAPINVSALASGVYMIQFRTRKGVVRKQFVKM